jgi:hypothetical protein
LGSGSGGIFQSTDDGVTWTFQLAVSGPLVAADWTRGVLYAAASPTGVLEISTNLQTVQSIGPPGIVGLGLVTAGGYVYVPGSGGHNTFVMKLDPSGNIVYSTYFGGSFDDVAVAMTVDSAGNVYVTGTTTSQDFPTTKGAYSSSPGDSFLYKLNPDGSVGYSTYFPVGASTPLSIAADSSGSAYVAGMTFGGLPTTPGAYKTVCGCLEVFGATDEDRFLGQRL